MSDYPQYTYAHDLWDAKKCRLRTASHAVLHGAIWDGFDGPTGVSKDEALEYAAELADWVLLQIDEF